MPTVTVHRANVTSEEVTEALRSGLEPRYEVQPGMRMPRTPLVGSPQPDRPELILVSSGRMVRAQVRIIRHSGMTDIRVTPGGVLADLLMNPLRIAPKIRRVLREAPGLAAPRA
jgi:hypothetical protein